MAILLNEVTVLVSLYFQLLLKTSVCKGNQLEGSWYLRLVILERCQTGVALRHSLKINKDFVFDSE